MEKKIIWCFTISFCIIILLANHCSLENCIWFVKLFQNLFSKLSIQKLFKYKLNLTSSSPPHLSFIFQRELVAEQRGR